MEKIVSKKNPPTKPQQKLGKGNINTVIVSGVLLGLFV